VSAAAIYFHYKFGVFHSFFAAFIKEVKRHSYYLKPGEKRRLKQALARKRARKKNRREPD